MPCPPREMGIQADMNEPDKGVFSNEARLVKPLPMNHDEWGIMKTNLTGAFAIALVAMVEMAAAPPVVAATALVDFETAPSIATGPSIYVAVPGPQTISAAPATFTGGVVLGFATFFPAISAATPPNVYGTADFGNGLSRTLSIAIDPAFATTEVSFALFNGETFTQTYSVHAFNGAASSPARP